MPTPRNSPGTQPPESDRRDSGRQRQDSQNDGQDEKLSEGADNVEVGVPVPESNRTVRASGDRQGLSNGQGETGEDEGLSGDAGDDRRH